MNKVSKRPFVPCAATVAAFTAANGLISAPYFPMSILPFFAAAVCAAVIVAVTQFLFIKITCIGNSFFKKTVYLLISISSVAAAVFALREYSRFYGLDNKKLRLAKADALVMHPGPMNRGVEISSEVGDGSQSVILDQVENGVAVRMALLYLVGAPAPDEEG